MRNPCPQSIIFKIGMASNFKQSDPSKIWRINSQLWKCNTLIDYLTPKYLFEIFWLIPQEMDQPRGSEMYLILAFILFNTVSHTNCTRYLQKSENIPATAWAPTIYSTADVNTRIECVSLCQASANSRCNVAVMDNGKCHLGETGVASTFLSSSGLPDKRVLFLEGKYSVQ